MLLVVKWGMNCMKLALDIVQDEFGPICFVRSPPALHRLAVICAGCPPAAHLVRATHLNRSPPPSQAVVDTLVALGQVSVQELCRHAATLPLFKGDGRSVGVKVRDPARPQCSARLTSLPSQVRGALLVLLTHDLIAVSVTMRAYATGADAAPTSGRRGGARGRGTARQRRGREPGRLRALASRVLAANLAAMSEYEVSEAEFGGLRYDFKPLPAVRRLRFPRYLEIVRAAAGEAGVAVARAMLQHGPWYREAVVEAAVLAMHRAESGEAPAPAPTGGSKRWRRSEEEEGEEGGRGGPEEEEREELATRAEAAWIKLEGAGFLARTTGLGVAFPALLLAGSLAGGTRTAGNTVANWEANVAARANVPPEPFKKKARVVRAGDGDGVAAAVAAAARAAAAIAPSETVRRAAQGAYRFAWDVADRAVRNEILRRYAAEGPGRSVIPGAGVVLAATMAAVGLKGETSTRTELSASVSVRDIMRQVRRPLSEVEEKEEEEEEEEEGAGAGRRARPKSASRAAAWDAGAATETSVEAICARLAELPHKLLILRSSAYIAPSERRYAVPYACASLAVQLRALQSLVEARYAPLVTAGLTATGGAGAGGFGAAPATKDSGLEPSRVLRLLLERGQLDEKAVSDCAMLEPKVARAILFKLVGDGLVTLQEVPRRPDRAPQHTLFLFNATWGRIMPILAEWCAAALLRMRIRARMERHRIAVATASGELPPAPTRTEWEDGMTSGRPERSAPPPFVGAAGEAAAAAAAAAAGEAGEPSDGVAALERARAGLRKLYVTGLKVEETLFLFSDL